MARSVHSWGHCNGGLSNSGGFMCIRTLKNGSKVVGLSISGKTFMLDKQVCHALSMEEERTNSEVKSVQSCVQNFKKELSTKFFQGTSEAISVSLKFNEGGDVDTVSAQVEFKGSLSEIPDEKKAEYVGLLENFLKAHNEAVLKHKNIIEIKLKTIISPKT